MDVPDVRGGVKGRGQGGGGKEISECDVAEITPTRFVMGGKDKRRKEEPLRSWQVAHILDCSPDDVIALARKGRLKATKSGRFWRFRFIDVMEYKSKLKTS